MVTYKSSDKNKNKEAVNVKILLFDFNNLLYKALAVMPDLDSDGKPTGALYGFIQQVCSKINAFKPDYVIVCNDSPPYFRKKAYPDYKKYRKTDRDEDRQLVANEARELCLRFLKTLNIQILETPGYEADDLIAKACEDLHLTASQITVISNDDDLFQIFQYSTNVYIQKNKVFYSVRNFMNDYPTLEPKQWPLFLALKGSHNGVPGLKGVGEKGALKILNDKELLKKTMKENKEKLELFQQLATLPYSNTLETICVKPARYDNKVVRFLTLLHIDLTGTMHKAFMQINH